MKGIEMILSNMLGVKPAEMKAMVEGLGRAANEGMETLQRIEANQVQILAAIERLENDNRNESAGSD